MKKSLLASTLIAAALAVPAFADGDDPSTDLTSFSISQNNPSLSLHDNSGIGYGLSVSGSGTAVISCDAGEDTPATISGTISSDEGFVQLSGGGYLNVTGTVSLEGGGYINYQGSTTFKDNTVKLGSIEFYQDDETICDVVFTGSNANATVGTITVDETEGSLTANLTVEKGATLSVGTMEINDDFAITIDAGTMELGGSASGSKSASITIENGGQLSITGDNVSLNKATIEIILSEDNISGSGSDGVYALIGEGSLENVTIKITVDGALATLLENGETTYTFDIYDTGLSISNDAFDYSALAAYGYEWNDSGQLIIGGLPEPELFSIFFGLGALGLVATRRRRRRRAA